MNSLQKKLITFTKSYKTSSSFNKANPNRQPTKAKAIFREEARVTIPYIKGLSEQYRHNLAKYRATVFFKGSSTITSVLMHPKDPIPDAQKTYII